MKTYQRFRIPFLVIALFFLISFSPKSDNRTEIGNLKDTTVESANCGPKGVTLHRGSKGGCYYINKNGNKTYVDRSCCNKK